MKKFLFTLATLFVAGSAFANSYLYMEKFDAASHIGGAPVTVPIKAHFEEYVSAWEVWFQLPDGIEIDYAEQGSDMTITYYKANGREGTLDAPLYFNGPGHYVTAVSDPGFGTDKVTYGCVKWEPGDYDEYMLVDFVVTDAYAGGDIVIKTQASCGQDTRFGEEMRALPEKGNTIAWVDETMTAALPELTADEALTKVTATEGAQIYRKDGLNPPAWHKVTNPFDLPEPTDVEQVINFMACMPNTTGMNGSDFVFLTVTIPAAAQEQPAPAATITNDGNVVTAAVDGEEAGTHTVELYIINGNDTTKVDNNPYTVPQTFDEQKITFIAKTIANEGESENTWSEPTEITIPAKADVVAPNPTIANNEGVVTATATGNHEVVLYVKNGDNWEVVEDGSFELPENNTFEDVTYYFKAYTKANGTDDNINSDEVFADFTVPGKDSKKAPAPTITEENGVVTATATGNHEVVLYVKNGDNWEVVEDGSFELPENNTYEDVTYYFKAYTKANGTDDNLPSDEVFADFTVPGKQMDQAVKPKITFTPDNGGVNVKIEDYTEYTIKVNGTQVDPTRNEHNYYVEKGDVDKEIVVYAKNAPENMIAADTTATYLLAAKTVYNTPNPVIGEPTVNDDDVTFTVTGEGTVTVTVTNGDKTDTYTGTGEVEVTIPRTDKDVTYTVNATAKSNKEGYDVINEGTASTTVTVPALQTEKPTITYEYGTAEFDDDGNVVVDGRYATITITNNDEKDAVIEYSLDGGETWNTYNPEVPVTVSGEGTHTVMARAKAEGKALSEVESVDIKIDKTTSVNELVNGKTVAGVRYFNMAGQEMQEANGITIVVTTYTDGTTSAVKVIK